MKGWSRYSLEGARTRYAKKRMFMNNYMSIN